MQNTNNSETDQSEYAKTHAFYDIIMRKLKMRVYLILDNPANIQTNEMMFFPYRKLSKVIGSL